MKTRVIRLLTMAMCLVMCAFVWPTAANAFDPVDLAHPLTLTILASDEETPLPDVTFSIHQVAEMDQLARFNLLSDFVSFNGDVNTLDTAEKQEAAAVQFTTLATGRTPDAVGVTDANGKVVFDALTPGMYLVVGTPVEILPWAYTFSPFIVTVPTRDPDDNWLYDVTADIKLERVTAVKDIDVVKVWEDEGHEDDRPNLLYVDLYCDGEVIETVQLHAGNSWSHTFKDLSAAHVYTVMEREVPKWYEATYENINGVLVIRNKSVAPETPVPEIPATGTIMWMVPILAGAGMLLFIIGWMLHRKWSNEHE